MIDEELADIRARVEAARAIIEGWNENARYVGETEDAISFHVSNRLSRAQKRALYQLQLHAWDDIPALLDEVERLRAENNRLREKMPCGHERRYEYNAGWTRDSDGNRIEDMNCALCALDRLDNPQYR